MSEGGYYVAFLYPLFRWNKSRLDRRGSSRVYKHRVCVCVRILHTTTANIDTTGEINGGGGAGVWNKDENQRNTLIYTQAAVWQLRCISSRVTSLSNAISTQPPYPASSSRARDPSLLLYHFQALRKTHTFFTSLIMHIVYCDVCNYSKSSWRVYVIFSFYI